MVGGSLLATADPFLYGIALTATDGVAIATLEDAAIAAIDRVRQEGLSDVEVARAKRQLRARLVFETDSVTNIAHQIGYFDVVAGGDFLERAASAVEAVTAAQVADVARRRLARETCTVGWFRPLGRRA
jgi:zinc protease